MKARKQASKARKKKPAARGRRNAAPRRTPATVAKRSAASSAPARDPLDDLILTAARSLGIAIEPAWMPAVRANLQATLTLGGMVGEFALPDDAEPAPVFRA